MLTGARAPPGRHRDERWHGLVPELFADIAAEALFTINMTDAPAAVYDAAPGSGSFDQCVFAVSLGYLDLCVGMFSITTLRSTQTPFFVLQTHPVFLMVPITEDSLLERIGRIFLPFDWSVWVLLLAFITLFSAVISAQESLHHTNPCTWKGSCDRYTRFPRLFIWRRGA